MGKFHHLASLDSQARFRLKVMDIYQRARNKMSTRDLCKLLGISRSFFYKWRKRYNPYNLHSLSTHSRKPRAQKTIDWKVVIEICGWKRNHPSKSHYYLYQWWLKMGRIPPCSPKTIYNWWKRRGLILLRHKRVRRKSKLFNQPKRPGELFQIDTKFLPDGRFQYTAIDVVSKWRFLRAYRKLTQKNTIDFLKRLLLMAKEKGVRIIRIQTDNGHEFQKEVVDFLKAWGVTHQYIWIHTPDQNGIVERSHRTDDEEFYQQNETKELSLEELNVALEEWTRYYNEERLHFALDFATPVEYLKKVSTI